MSNVTERAKRSIYFYDDGVQISGNEIKGARNRSHGTRGEIKGWSKSSRRRMRMYMLNHKIEEGLESYNVTMTIPGPPLSPSTTKDLWADWCMRANKAGWSAVWRMEIQKRGSIHFHCMVSVPKELANPEEEIKKSWWQALQRVPTQYYPDHSIAFFPKDRRRFKDFDILPESVPFVSSCGDLMCFFGAYKYSCHVESAAEKTGAWKRYMQDHASKTKQEQIPENVGRHWGVIGRKRFVQVIPNDAVSLSPKEFNTFLRLYQRLCTPTIRNEKFPFGRALGRRIRRGSWGQSVWYSNPSTVRRLMEWSISMHEELAEAD